MRVLCVSVLLLHLWELQITIVNCFVYSSPSADVASDDAHLHSAEGYEFALAHCLEGRVVYLSS